MPAINAITPDKLARLISTPNCPAIIDVRTADDFAADSRHLPGAESRHGCGRRASLPKFSMAALSAGQAPDCR